MNQSKITIRYAKALFDLALENKKQEQVKNDMALIDQTCSENRELRLMLHNPVINLERKLKVLKGVFGQKIDPISMLFLQVLARKRRDQYIHSIASAYITLYKEYSGLKTAYVTSATGLNESERTRMRNILKNITDKDIELVETIKDDVIGGFILTMDNYQVDQSLNNQIKELKKEFEKNLYIKGF